MGAAATCCRPNVKDGIIGEQSSGVQVEHYQVCQGESTNERVRPVIDQFRYEEGFQEVQSQQWMKNKEKEEYYLGSWDQQEMRGKGVLYSPQKFAYYGDFDHYPHGRGKLINYSHDITYTGEVCRGVVHGQGRVNHNKGWYQFEGKLVEGRPQSGKLIVYEPETREWKFSAEITHDHEVKAVINYADKRHYEGQINTKTFMPEGYGIMKYNNDSAYEGDWQDGKFHGNGRFTWFDGSMYYGDYVEGIKQGKGKFVYPSKRCYEGYWANGKQHGEGTLYNETGDVHQRGYWREGSYDTEQNV